MWYFLIWLVKTVCWATKIQITVLSYKNIHYRSLIYILACDLHYRKKTCWGITCPVRHGLSQYDCTFDLIVDCSAVLCLYSSLCLSYPSYVGTLAGHLLTHEFSLNILFLIHKFSSNRLITKHCKISIKSDTFYDDFININMVFLSLTLVLLNPDMSFFANSVDPDHLASEEANWSGSALLAIEYVNLYQQSGSSNLIG